MLRALTLWIVVSLVATGCGKFDQRAPTKEDAIGLVQVLKQTRDVVRAIKDNEEAFEAVGDLPLGREDRELLMPIWSAMIDHDFAYASYKQNFLEHWKHAETEEARVQCLILGYTAHVAQLHAVLTLVNVLGDRDNFITALDEGDLEYGISPGHLDHMVRRTISPHTYLILNIGHNSLRRYASRFLDEIGDTAQCGNLFTKAKEAGVVPAHPDDFFRSVTECVLDFSGRVVEVYQQVGPRLMEQVIEEIFSAELNEIILPIQTDIAIWLGDTKFRNEGEALISLEQIEGLIAPASDREGLPAGSLAGVPGETLAALPLQPGDILIERRNWYLSNLGLPGFWPHAALYLGSAAEMSATFDGDPGVIERLAKDGYTCGAYTNCLAQAYPDVWAIYDGLDEEGHTNRVLEAVSEGVVFTSLEHSAYCDYLGVMRPNLDPVDIAFAILHGFQYHGRPYDFEFDFASDATLVCSEVVYKAYDLTSTEGTGIQFELADVMGRYTLPPNDMVELFDGEYETDSPQMSFVAFLDGQTSQKSALWGTVESYRESWRRPKWDLSQ